MRQLAPESRKMIAAPSRVPFKPTTQTGQLPDTIRGRPRYPCTICNSTDHLDSWHRLNDNSQRPTDILARGPGVARPGIKVHFADHDKENAPEEIPETVMY
jgi:hypothetical protein